MTSSWSDVAEKLKALAGSWPAYVALGSFGLYVMGYLALRFHLTALGVGTDINVLDERYLFAGAKFLVYLVSFIPTLLLLLLVPIALLYMFYRILPRRIRSRSGGFFGRFGQRLVTWCSAPHRLALAGIIISVVLIQFVMRKCFLFSNLLLAQCLGGSSGLRSLLLDADLQALYFIVLVGGTVLTAILLVAARMQAQQTSLSRVLTFVLGVLVIIQFLLLPVNYGVLISDKWLPKVADLGGHSNLNPGQEAWLVWEGNNGVTFLIRTRDQSGEKRSLVTLPRQDIKRTEIVGYENIITALFGESACK